MIRRISQKRAPRRAALAAQRDALLAGLLSVGIEPPEYDGGEWTYVTEMGHEPAGETLAEALQAFVGFIERTAPRPEGHTNATTAQRFEKSLVGADFKWGDPPIPVLCFTMRPDARVFANMTFEEMAALLSSASPSSEGETDTRKDERRTPNPLADHGAAMMGEQRTTERRASSEGETK